LPEYPDIELYLHALRARIQGQKLLKLQIRDPFVLRSVQPSPAQLEGRRLESLTRLGKRLVMHFEGGYFALLHLMIAGRFRFSEPSVGQPAKRVDTSGARAPGGCLVLWQFESGWLGLSEAGSKRRARLHLGSALEDLQAHDPGGLELQHCSLDEFGQRLQLRRHTLKRALTDPTLFSGIGNAYSDEILLRSCLSPVRLTTQLDETEILRLFRVCRSLLEEWRLRLIEQWGEKFPTTVTAFHPQMAAHGKYLQPCPQCGSPIQRIRYADNETNYCAQCQTGGRLLADRSLSRLLKQDWPKTIEEMEERFQRPP